MGVDAANELAGKSFEEKCEWIKIKKEIGNNFVKENKIEEALPLDTYLLFRRSSRFAPPNFLRF